MTLKPVFITYETPFAPCGGIAPVMRNLPPALGKVAGQRVAVLSPYHHRIAGMCSLQTEVVGEFRIPFEGGEVCVRIHHRRDECDWYFLRATDDRFFAGERHPYEPGGDLLRDSLLFGRAVIETLQRIGPEVRWGLFMQDWEAVTPVLAHGGRLPGSKFFLVLHNSYDSPVSDEALFRYGIDPAWCPGVTVLHRALPLVEPNIPTVSKQFAFDLIEEIWQRCVIAPHLQERLVGRLLGIDNGPFVKSALGEKTLKRMRAGEFSSFKRWKTIQRKKFLTAVRELPADPTRPVWGNPDAFLGDRGPWFVMAGRDDPRQKGYDIAASTVACLL